MRLRHIALSVLLLSASNAKAEESERTATLSWDVPPGCLDQTGLEREVEQRLGRAVFVGPKESDVTLTVREEGTGLPKTVLEVSSRGRSSGTRVVEPTKSCVGRRRTVALVAAMLLDAPREEEPAEKETPSPEPPAPVEPMKSPPGVARDEPRPTPRPTRRRSNGIDVSVSAFAAVHAGLLPRFGEGGFAELVVGPPRWPRLRAIAGGSAGATVGARQGEATFASFDASLAIVPIVLEPTPRTRVLGWLGGTLDAVVASPSGFDVNRAGTTTLFGATAGVAFQVELSRSGFMGSAELEGAVPFSRPAFFAQQDGRSIELHRVGPVGGGASLGIGWRGP
jgi:hypothetical protein